MQLVDTHCHIQSIDNSTSEPDHTHELWAKSPELTPELVIDSAIEQGVTKLLCVGCYLEDSVSAIEFASNRDNCWASVGIHPHEAQRYARDQVAQQAFTDLATRPKVVGIGECGLDYFYNHSPREDQIMLLRLQIELALEHNLPLIFHVREAFDDFWPVFNDYSGIRGVLHSFTDSVANLDIALEKGLFIGVNGIATFAKEPTQIDVYRKLPLQNLLLETDAPYLTPTPYRGRINESKYIRRIAEFMAGLRDESLDVLAAATTDNAQHLFGF